MIVFTSFLLSSSPTLKKKMMKEGKKKDSFTHSRLMLKSQHQPITSFSLGQVIRPSILIKAPKGQKYLQGGRPEDRTQKGTPKQNKITPLVFQAFIFSFFLFLHWCPLGSDAAFDYWYSFLVTNDTCNPSFVLSSTQVEATKPFKAGKKIWIWFTSLYSQLQNSARIRKHTQQSNWYQMPKPWSPFSILYRKVSWVLFQFARVLKESSSKYGYPVFLPEQSGKSIERGEGRKGEAYRQHTGSGCCH